MSLAESQRILTSPFRDYKAIPLELQKPLSSRSDDGLGLVGLTVVYLSKATCFTPKTKTKQDPSQETWASCPLSVIMKERPPPPAVQTEVGALSLSHRSVSHSLSHWSGSHVCSLATGQVG